MAERTRLATIVMGRSMKGEASSKEDPKIMLELEAETGEIFEIPFSVRGIMTTVVLAHNWPALKEALADLEPPLQVR